MGTPSVDGIFADAVNIAPGEYNSNHYGDPSVVGEYCAGSSSQELGAIVGDGIVLSPNEAQMFKKIQKIVSENKNLKKALITNSELIQNHVTDCIQWKDNNKIREDGLKEQLKTEKQKSTHLQKRLDFLNTALSTSSMSMSNTSSHAPVEFFIAELNKQVKMLAEVLRSPNEPSESEEAPIISKAYETCISAISEFVTKRNHHELDGSLLNVQNFCIPLHSHDGKILKDAITSIQNASRDYQRAVTSIQGGQHVPLVQHIQLKDQLDIIMEENQHLKGQLNTFVLQCDQKEIALDKVTKERDELQNNNIDQSALIHKLRDELDNCKSVEVLNFASQEQPKEIKQLELNIEGYKNTIQYLKDQNVTLNADLNESYASFEKIEDENSELRDNVERMQNEINRLNNLFTNAAESYYIPDVDTSTDQLKITLQQYCLKLAESDRTIKTLNDELNTSQMNQSSDESFHRMNAKIEILERTIQQLNEALRDKQEELINAKKEREDKEGEKSETHSLKHMVKQLSLKDEDIKKTSEMLSKAEQERAASLNHCKNVEEKLKMQEMDFEMKNRVLKKRESKDADRINSLLKVNEEMKNDFERMRNENEELRKHIESVNNAIQEQELSNEQQFANLLGKSEELMSIDQTKETHENESNYEYVQQILAENTEHLEKAEKMRMDIQILQEEGEMKDQDMEELKQENLQSTRMYATLQKEHQLLQAQLEQQLFVLRKELNNMQQQADGNVSKREFAKLQEQLAASQKACELLKRDNQQAWNNVKVKVKNVKELEEKMNAMTREIVAAKEHIGELRDKENASDNVIAALRENEKRTVLELQKMNEQVEEVGVLKMQLEVYKNDFQAERESRETQQETLLGERDRVQQLQLENHHLKEELQKKGDRGLNNIRTRHGGWQNNPQSIDPRQTYQPNQQNYGARPQGVEQQYSHWQHPQHGVNDQWEVYGRGNEQNGRFIRQPARPVNNNRMENDEQRKCPKCQSVLPDLDSLQIHVMECLDK